MSCVVSGCRLLPHDEGFFFTSDAGELLHLMVSMHAVNMPTISMR